MIVGERQAGMDAQTIHVLSAARSPTTVADTGQRMGRSEVRGRRNVSAIPGGVAARSDNYGMCLQGLVLARGIGERFPKRAELRFSVIVLFCLERSRWTVYLECPAFGSFVRRGNVGSAD